MTSLVSRCIFSGISGIYKNYPKNVSEITNAKFEVGTLSDDFINPKQKKINRSDCDIHPRATNECNPRR